MNQQFGYPGATDWTILGSKFGSHADFHKRCVQRLGKTNEQVKGDVLFAPLNGANVIAMAVNELSQILLGQADGTAALSYGRPKPTTLRGCRTNSHAYRATHQRNNDHPLQ